ncbi:hypothetical protein VNO78_04388 [Psophocarpus tetragonolobus]|uniref:Uncharacterized protein n=1 Tax=Psophocarpus tetragonolobus TaxID=3891 RepID=A0AAN9XXG2_PSOTE
MVFSVENFTEFEIGTDECGICNTIMKAGIGTLSRLWHLDSKTLLALDGSIGMTSFSGEIGNGKSGQSPRKSKMTSKMEVLYDYRSS